MFGLKYIFNVCFSSRLTGVFRNSMQVIEHTTKLSDLSTHVYISPSSDSLLKIARLPRLDVKKVAHYFDYILSHALNNN